MCRVLGLLFVIRVVGYVCNRRNKLMVCCNWVFAYVFHKQKTKHGSLCDSIGQTVNYLHRNGRLVWKWISPSCGRLDRTKLVNLRKRPNLFEFVILNIITLLPLKQFILNIAKVIDSVDFGYDKKYF